MKYTITIILAAILTISLAVFAASDSKTDALLSVQERIQQQQQKQMSEEAASEDSESTVVATSECFEQTEKYTNKVVKYENKIAKYGKSNIRLWKLNYYGERLAYWEGLCTPAQ